MIIEKIPLTAEPRSGTPVQFAVEGMTLASCVLRLEKAIAAAGADWASVNLVTERAEVVFFEKSGLVSDLKAVADDIGIGSDWFMNSLGVDTSSSTETAASLAEAGKTLLHVANDGRLAAVIAVADPTKESLPPAIKPLRALRMRIAMVTGDNRCISEAISRRLGNDKIVAEALRLKRFRVPANEGEAIDLAPRLAVAN